MAWFQVFELGEKSCGLLLRLALVLGEHHKVDQGLRVVGVLLQSLPKGSLCLGVLALRYERNCLAVQQQSCASQFVNHLLSCFAAVRNQKPIMKIT